jgi:Na+/H+-dicarboxylate symporter
MEQIVTRPPRFSLSSLSKVLNRPVVTLGSVAFALALGASRLPVLQYLRPIGELYVALLQMCVLPFLLAAIPLAVRSAMTSGTAGHVLRSLMGWLGVVIVVVALFGVVVAAGAFYLALLWQIFAAGDSQITFSVTHGWSAFGGADHG